MKVFYVTFSGKYIEGSMVIVEETKVKAFSRAEEKIDELGLSHKNTEFSIDDNIREIDLNEAGIAVLNDGDY